MRLLELLLVVPALLCACGPGAAPVPPPAIIPLAPLFDGRVKRRFSGSFTADEPQEAVIIDLDYYGADQGSLIILDHNGERLAQYRCPITSPFARAATKPLRQSHVPSPESVVSTVYDGRRFVVFTMVGGLFPSALVVLEATSRSELTPRALIWNVGHFHSVAIDASRVVAAGLDNSRRNEAGDFGGAVVVADLEAMPKSGKPVEMRLDELPLTAPVEALIHLPIDGTDAVYPTSATIRGPLVSVQMERDFVFEIDLDTGDVRAVAASNWDRRYAERQRYEPELPPDGADHLNDLARRVDVIRPE